MAHSLKFSSFICGLFLIALIFMQPIDASTQDNEVGDSEYSMIQGVKVYGIDRECAMVGGLCVHTSDCLQATTNKGLCSSSSHLGVECCYELPVRPAPCVQHMGACMERCNKMLMRPGTDCEQGTVCCVLI